MGKDLQGKELGKGFRQRADGRYEARAKINNVNINLYNTNLTSLKKEFDAAKRDVLAKKVAVGGDITLADWYKNWFENYKSPSLKSVSSRKSYDRKIRTTLIAILGDKKLSDIKQIDIQKAANELLESRVERTVREAVGVLRECLDIAVVNDMICNNPCVHINIVGHDMQEERRVLTKEEQDRFFEEVKDTYYYEAYAILLLTGMRIGEFTGLQWCDVDFENKVIHIRRSMQTAYVDGEKIEELTTPKTNNSKREIPFLGNVEELFRSWKTKQDIYRKKLGDRWRARPELGDLVFTSTMGSPVSRYVIVHDINEKIKDINLKEIYRAVEEKRAPIEFEHFSPHSLRHTFCSRLHELRMNPILIQKIMGHANYQTTLSYTHLSEQFSKEEIDKVGDSILGTN